MIHCSESCDSGPIHDQKLFNLRLVSRHLRIASYHAIRVSYDTYYTGFKHDLLTWTKRSTIGMPLKLKVAVDVASGLRAAPHVGAIERILDGEILGYEAPELAANNVSCCVSL
ncbi:hypothetical protein Fmac_016233 [Flemingia macrophylla]|uniref:Uncharacterized protein n=1 Tax=Flemingia macrophylla TaxID=520843 RepID=A0ABD1MGU7_9FABA